MVFNSLVFVAFFAFVLAMHNLPFSWRQKKVNLLVLSYIFYSAWNPPFVILLWLSTVVDWYAAQALVHAKDRWHRRLWMLISVVANLGMLSYFKYGQFLLDNFASALALVGVSYQPPHMNIVLPVGISFYTFATMSYTLDVYLRRATPARNFLDYALFVTFFPHLVAGPIMRPTELVPQFAEPKRANRNQLFFGLALMTVGLFEKIVLADGFLSPVVEAVYDSRRPPGFIDAWLSTFAFSGQIFCDFAGYSTTAIGVALCLGFAMPDNFCFPYAAIGFSDFWRRWHITLSSWLRDYVYIPLGGNRHGAARTYAALMGTMLLGGLWHGASWTFIIWGGLHGTYLAVERFARRMLPDFKPQQATLTLLGVVTFLLVNVAWVFFRAKTFTRAWDILQGMAGVAANPVPQIAFVYLITTPVIVAGLLAAHAYLRNRTLEQAIASAPPAFLTVVWASLAAAIAAEQGSGDAFIYFQF